MDKILCQNCECELNITGNQCSNCGVKLNFPQIALLNVKKLFEDDPSPSPEFNRGYRQAIKDMEQIFKPL